MTERIKSTALVWAAATGFLLMLVDAFSLNSRFYAGPFAATMSGGGVTRAQLDAALSRVGGSADSEVRGRVLDFLIDEELLVLRAQAVGLVESDRTIRKALSRTVIDQQVKEALAYVPTDDELRRFYDEHRALFTSGETIYLKQLFFNQATLTEQSLAGTGLNARDRAEATRRALLAGEEPESYGDPLPNPLPEVLIPVSILHRQLGPTMAARVKTLRPGQVSEVIDAGGGYHLFVGRDYTAAVLRPYDAIKDEVRSEYRRRARDHVLEKKLRALWAQSTIRIAQDLTIDLAVVNPQ